MIDRLCAALGLSRFTAAVIGLATLVGAIVALYLVIHRDGEKAGAARIEAKSAQAHSTAVADARHDERASAVSTAAIGADVAAATEHARDATRSTIEDIHHAIAAVPPAAPGAALPPAPVDGLRDDLNAAIARANRAAGHSAVAE